MRVSKAEEEIGLDASQHDEKYLQGTLLVKENTMLVEDNGTLLTKKERDLTEMIDFWEKLIGQIPFIINL